MKKPPPLLDEIKQLSTKIHTYQSVQTLLHWDAETYMPEGAISPRSQQLAELASLIHEEKTSRKFKQALSKLIHLHSGKPTAQGKKLSHLEKVMLREWRKDFLRMTKLPTDFVKTFSHLTSEASQVWRVAKKENNFQLFAPLLEEIINLNRKKAKILGFKDHPYDALLETYEPCMTAAKVGDIFTRLKKAIVPLVKEIQKHKSADQRFLSKTVDLNTQTEIGHLLLSKLPLDPKHSRLDLSSHPFSLALHPLDSRITTRLIPNAFMSNLFSILHEVGHSLYETGLPQEYFGTPLCEATSLTIHESQSRFWETMIGRSLPFWKYFYPLLQKKLPHLAKVSLNHFYHAIHRVEPSFIRVEADEVTYCLHIILRFEIEKELIEGSLSVANLPDAWNQKMKSLFGITPPNDSMGCLQDIHWSLGDFGYFPTYALGNIAAAQFFKTLTKKYPDWEKRVSLGDLDFIRSWLKENIHSLGKTYNTDQLIKKVTGTTLNEKAYCRYLKEKYTELML